MRMATWRPNGGPEEHRDSNVLTDEILANFRNHKVVGGHAKWPNQTDKLDDHGFYLPDGKGDERKAVEEMYYALSKMSPNPTEFNQCVEDDASFGMRTWEVRPPNYEEHLINVSTTSIFNAYYASSIHSLIKQVGGRIVDIGGGYGHLAKELSRYAEQVTLVELPANIPLAEAYLEGTAVKVQHPKLDFPQCDIIVNTMSFQHMLPENLDYYHKRILDSGAKAIYTVNRLAKKDATDTPIYDYPFWQDFFPIHVKAFGQMWQEIVAQRKPGKES